MSRTKDPNSKSNFLKNTDSAPSQKPEYSKYKDAVFICCVIFITIILVGSGYLLIRNMGLPLEKIKNVIEIEKAKLKKTKSTGAPSLLYTLSVSSTPSEARIYLDGEYGGTTPNNIEISKGWHKIKLEKDGYQILENDIKIYDGDEDYSCVLKKMSEKEAIKESTEETPKVACELPIKSYVGGSRILKMDEDECVEQKGKILWHIEPLPSNIPHDKYIDCLLPDSTSPVFMKAGACLNSQGRIINAP